MSDILDVPIFLADGSSLFMDHDFIKRLREGDPTVGWTGDERLSVYKGPDDRLIIARLCEDGETRVIMRSKPGHRFLNTATLQFLAEHDGWSRRAYDPVKDIIENNLAQERAQRDKLNELHGELGERLAYAFRKDVGHHYGLTSRQFTAVPENVAKIFKKDETK